MKKNNNILLIGSKSGIGLQLRKDLSLKNNIFLTSSKRLKNENYLNFFDEKSIKKTLKKAYSKYKYFDKIIFNSFITDKRKKFSQRTLSKFKQNIKHNIFGYLLIISIILKYQKKNSELVFISTEAVKNSSWGLSSYVLSKSAIESFLKTICNENNKFKVKIIRLKKYRTPGYFRVNGNLNSAKSVKLASIKIQKAINT